MEIAKFIDLSPKNCRIKAVLNDRTIIVEDQDGKDRKIPDILLHIHNIYVDKEKQNIKFRNFVDMFNQFTAQSRTFYAKMYHDLHHNQRRIDHIWSGEEGFDVMNNGKDVIEQRSFLLAYLLNSDLFILVF